MSFLFILDGVQFNSPINDKDLVTTIKRGANLDGFLITQDADLTFIGDAYDYLLDKFDNEGFCSEVEIQILDDCGDEIHEVYTGIIKLSSAEFEEQRCECKVKVEDNSFYSYINNNKSMDISPTQNGTKTGEPVDPPSVWEIDMFNPTNPINVGTWEHRGYRVYDLLEHAISVMTDNKVGFTSDFLWNQMDELFLTTGNALSVPGNNPTFTYTFEKLYSELNKQFNLSFFIEKDQYSLPTLRIEPKDYFFSTSTGLTFSDIKELKKSADQSKLYGTVVLGSNTLANDQGLYDFNETNPFFGFGPVKFYPIGQCNLDTQLDLTNDYIISHNVVADCVIGSSAEFNDSLVFISCENLDLLNLQAVAITYTLGSSSTPYIYNLNLNNYNKAQRHFGFLPGNLMDAFNISSNNFHVTKAVNEVFAVGASGTETPLNYVSGTGWIFQLCYPNDCGPASFPDETTAGNYDLGGNYDNTTYIYTIPSDGQYTFNASFFIDILNSVSATDAACYVSIKRYDNTLVTLLEQNITGTVMPLVTGGAEVAKGSAVFDCLAGEKIYCTVDFVVECTNPPSGANLYRFSVRDNSFFESTSDNVIVSATDINYKIIRYEFQYPLTGDQIRFLVDDPTGLQYFTKWSEILKAFRTRRAWIEEIKVNNWTGLASVKLIANNAIIQE